MTEPPEFPDPADYGDDPLAYFAAERAGMLRWAARRYPGADRSKTTAEQARQIVAEYFRTSVLESLLRDG